MNLLGKLFRKAQLERDLNQELHFHIEQQIEDYIAAGMTEQEARRKARLEFGSLDVIKEECRDARGLSLLRTTVQDIRHTIRTFARMPGFTAICVVTIALGIGTNTAIFSVVNTVLLKPLHAPQPDRVVVFMSTSKPGSTPLASQMKFNLWREQTSVFQEVSAYYTKSVDLTSIDQPQRLSAIFVTKDYFHLFDLPVARGRSFTDEEERPNGSNIVVLSDSLWKNVFDSDPQIIGKTISLGGSSHEVIGVMVSGVQTETPESPDVWMPFPIDPNSEDQSHYFQVAGRLKPGITLDMANAQLQFTTQEFRRKFPNSLSTSRGETFGVQPMQDVLVKDARSSLLILAGAVSFVLLIACANVANLLLVRAAGRRREIVIRVAVGASRGRIIRQLLTESVLVSMIGGVFGLGLGMAGIRMLLALSPVNIPRIGANGSNVTMDWRVLAFTMLMALITGLLFGLIPALRASRTDLNSNLKDSGGRTGTGFRENKLRSLLVISEVSLALVLLIGAALLIRTLITLRDVDPGFDPGNVVTTQATLDPGFAKARGIDQMFQDVLQRLNALPGVEVAAFTNLLPLQGNFNGLPIVVAGRPLNGPSHGNSRWMIVSPDYFDVLRIPLIRGRFFTDADRRDAPGVAIINQAMARQFWPGGDPLGGQFFIGKGLGPIFEEPARQIVGIVGDVHEDSLDRNPVPAVFVPAAQPRHTSPSILGGPGDPMAARTMWIVVRTRTHSGSLNAAIQSQLRQATGGLPIPPIRSMEEITAQSTARQSFNMLLMNIFGGSALLLATIGIYGLVAYTVQQRKQEMGIRMALGAKSSDVRNMVVFQGMGLTFVGIAIGMAVAFGLTRFLSSFLFGVKALDPLVFILVPILLTGVASVAVWLPFRASRIDPVDALRYE